VPHGHGRRLEGALVHTDKPLLVGTMDPKTSVFNEWPFAPSKNP